jgi:hypothetical protein
MAQDNKFQQEVKALVPRRTAESHRRTHPAMSVALSDNAPVTQFSGG